MRRPSFAALAALLMALPLLAGCATDSIMAKLNKIRGQTLPVLEKQLAAADSRPGAPLYIRVFKEEGVMETWVRNSDSELYMPFRIYQICAYSGGLGPKLAEGDKQAPEGFYDVTLERLHPASKYHLAMNIGYPNLYDAALGRTGSKLMIHGACISEGCFAMTDQAIEEIYILAEQSLLAGNRSVPVHVFPFRMTPENMARHAGSEWMPFWTNLKQGYDFFQQNHVPPAPGVGDGNYIFLPQIFRYAGAV